MWAKFDQFAHDVLNLWYRCREQRNSGTEGSGPTWAINHEALSAYLNVGAPFVDDHEDYDILDGVRVVNRVKNTGQ